LGGKRGSEDSSGRQGMKMFTPPPYEEKRLG